MTMHTINPTTLKAVTGCLLAVVIVCAALAGSLCGHPVDVAILVELCLFVSAILGISAWSRGKDRTTDYGYVERMHGSTTPPEPPSEPTP